MKIVIVGGVAGGATAISRLRRLDEAADIVLFERGPYVSFANCGLPYYISGVISQRDHLLVATKEGIEAKYHVDIRINSNVTVIDRAAKTVSVEDVQTGQRYEEPYDVLILSTGSSPLVPPIPGIDGDGIFTLWTIPDVDRITDHIKTQAPRSAVVVGGGFIGLEVAENLAHKGIAVTLVEAANQVMAPLDFDLAQAVHRHLVNKGVRLLLNDGVQAFSDHNGQKQVQLQSGQTVEADMVLLSIGVRPNGQLAAEAGLEMNARGGVVVDAQMQTSDPSIYAIGDMVEVTDFVSGQKTMVPLAGPANKQGRIVADNVCGIPSQYAGTMGTSVAKVFDLTVAAVGQNEKALQKQGKVRHQDYHTVVVHPLDHAGYYPGATDMSLKLVFDTSGKILGAQIVGVNGVDKRIDVIATAIHFGGNVSDLTQLELAYAPPYSSAKDPVNMAGYVAENLLTGKVAFIAPDEIDDSVVLLDVRERPEVKDFALPGTLNMPLSMLRDRLHELDRSKRYVVFCVIGLRGYLAARILSQAGFDVVDMSGGLASYLTYFYQVPDTLS